MDLAGGCSAKKKIKMKELKCDAIGLNTNTILIIKLPVLRIMSRSFFLAMAILTLPSIGSFLRGSSSDPVTDSEAASLEMLPLLFRDLFDEGLLKEGHKGLIITSGIVDLVDDLRILSDNDIDLIIESDLDRQNSVADDSLDVVFTSSFKDTKFIDRVLKIGGIAVTQLGNDPSDEFQPHLNYKIVYLRRFDSTVVAMRKVGLMDDGLVNSSQKGRLCGVTPEAKKEALKGLEDVLLEPPRRALARLIDQSKKIKFLPDLLGDSLESYEHRIFISDERNGAVEWFNENYPKRDQEFETYNLEIEMRDMERVDKNVVPVAIGISDWLTKNVREDDFVVMKAEAQVVEEMIEEKTICLVDELFLECRNQWQDGNSKRAYWQCLTLYGRLRDDGVAVHQWWTRPTNK
ncbi:hypothetical protein RJ640_018503 [Escallonia rubra]|uniref:DUF7870 domain-containing protein n=1 Tax=Escallonia rubra TaxID=112253 RepID=A0AA88UIE8_9ASTE|nr:hypothetical protein RJ640_018503 [Escallonia rubra]